ncbi:MAG: ferrous iron transport protein B [Candidatus Fimivicinus sp.]|nr:ferrous iron transport protein B [Oscillospiraceae bacterium]MDY5591795.1 ferrous iron transport protein B [Candidatus Fimivicinus sp.]
MSYRYALAGNPNCGKTTLFNAVTGSNQYVGNWPGVTVEKKEGKVIGSETDASIVDLPGIYSLSPYSMEEIVTRNYLIDEKPDLIINIVDATNLERNLYLSLQIAELGRPMVIALNMVDMLEKRGDTIDYPLLSALLGITIVPISASRGTGIHKLIHAAEHEVIHATSNTHLDRHCNLGDPPDLYTGAVRQAVKLIEDLIRDNCKEHDLPLRWSAVKLIEGDAPTLEKLNLSDTQLSCLESIVRELETDHIDREMVIADQKYRFICSVTQKAVKKGHEDGHLTVSDRVDQIVTNRYLAIPLFFAIMGLVFYITFGALGPRLSDLVGGFINGTLAGAVRGLLTGIGAADWATGLVCDGIIAGLGAVLAFLPQILLLFFFLSILEDSGYMARAAFIMDRALHVIGLSGKSFVPMLMGFGCSVPAVMSSRTLENEKDRRLTIMLIPFMSCSAKMPIYSLFIAAFFGASRGLAVCSIYLLGVVVAILCAFLLQKTVLKGGHAPFVMELPPYRLPTAKTLSLHVWEKLKDFLTKAGTVLLGASVVVWALQYFNFSFQHVQDSSQSILGLIGTAIAPLFRPLGFGDWQSSVSLLSGLIAREQVVSSLGILYGTSGAGLAAALQAVYTPASAYAFMTFALLFIPCIAAVTTIRREMNSRKWTLIALSFQAVVAYFVTFVVYQLGRLVMLVF